MSCEFGSAKYYALCGFGGILSCGITHTAVVPLDLVKCRLQVCMATQHGAAGRAQRLTLASTALIITPSAIIKAPFTASRPGCDIAVCRASSGEPGQVQKHRQRLRRDGQGRRRPRPGQGLGPHLHRLLHAGTLQVWVLRSFQDPVQRPAGRGEGDGCQGDGG